MRTVSIRLSDRIAKRLEQVAEAEGRSKSAIIRDSIEAYLAPRHDTNLAWELGKALFGKCSSGRSDLSVNGEKILRERFPVSRP